ncbi:DUF4280 domain-containing protein [Paenibacillus sp.]|jgi:hypothetical protein|uniref:DUF4280 domain-containing protein n=1 Tax=Paenibacillus sp. TaxID=58172 RepID=UPI00282B58D5|nr:DUF4280 domain-containing protein [Paenibacillus sp.]MDR0266772.1 DUF4280 domain-containing protein [Paenibacillus sp.]
MAIPPYSTFLTKATIQKLTVEEKWRSEDTYVTRGAYMYCSFGTHEDILNQTESHGVYVNGNPLMTVEDCVVASSDHVTGDVEFDEPGKNIDGNIYSFGFCRSLAHPLKLAEISSPPLEPELIGGQPVLDETPYIFDPENPGNKIYPCVPQFDLGLLATADSSMGTSARWAGGKKNVLIQGVPALTSNSCLFCRWTGVIRFLTNGMDPAPYELLPGGIK